MSDLDLMESLGWTWDELMSTPYDVVVALREMRAAQAEATRIKRMRGEGG